MGGIDGVEEEDDVDDNDGGEMGWGQALRDVFVHFEGMMERY